MTGLKIYWSHMGYEKWNGYLNNMLVLDELFQLFPFWNVIPTIKIFCISACSFPYEIMHPKYYFLPDCREWLTWKYCIFNWPFLSLMCWCFMILLQSGKCLSGGLLMLSVMCFSISANYNNLESWLRGGIGSGLPKSRPNFLDGTCKI